MGKKHWKSTIIAMLLMAAMVLSACGNSQKDVYEQNAGQTESDTGTEDTNTDGKSDAEDGSVVGNEAGNGEGQGEEEKPEPVKKDLSGELTFQWLNNNFAMEQLAEGFKALYPNVKITFLESGNAWDYYDQLNFEKQLATDLMSGNAADIVEVTCFDYAKVARNGLLCDFYEFMEQDSEFRKEDYFANIFEALEVDGGLYGVPLGFQVKAVWLNKAVTDAIGLDMGQELTVTGKQIFDMYDAAEATGKLPAAFGLDRYGIWDMQLMEEKYQYDTIAQTAQFDTPEYIDFLERLKAIEEPVEGGYTDPKAVTSCSDYM